MKKVISYILAIILAVFIVGDTILLICYDSVFDKDGLKKQIREMDYYSELTDIIKDRLSSYVEQSGFDKSMLDDVVTKERVEADGEKIVDSIYAGKEIEISSDDIKKAIDTEVQEYINKNNYKITASVKKDIEEFENEISNVYVSNITYSKDTLNKVATNFLKAKKMIITAICVCAGVSIVLAIIIFVLNGQAFGISLISAGAICIFIRYYKSLGMLINNILIVNQAFSKLIISIANQALQILLYSGIGLCIFGFIFIWIFASKDANTKIREKERRED